MELELQIYVGIISGVGNKWNAFKVQKKWLVFETLCALCGQWHRHDQKVKKAKFGSFARATAANIRYQCLKICLQHIACLLNRKTSSECFIGKIFGAISPFLKFYPAILEY